MLVTVESRILQIILAGCEGAQDAACLEALRSSLTPLCARSSITEGTFLMHIIVEQPKDEGASTLSVPKCMVIK